MIDRPRSQDTRTWTREDHLANDRLKQRAADALVWDRLGEVVGLSGRDLAAAFGRLVDDRLAAASPNKQLTFAQQLAEPATAVQLRPLLADLLAEDIGEMFQILINQGIEDEPRDSQEIEGGRGPNAANR